MLGLRPRAVVVHPRLKTLNYNLVVPVLHNLRVTLEMIKWEHSIFALPFALCGAMLAAGGFPSSHQFVWIVVAMIAARSAAMAFNRLADASIDAANPRTSTRALPAGHLTPAFVATFVVVSSAIFVVAASQLNRLACWLSPVLLRCCCSTPTPSASPAGRTWCWDSRSASRPRRHGSRCAAPSIRAFYCSRPP